MNSSQEANYLNRVVCGLTIRSWGWLGAIATLVIAFATMLTAIFQSATALRQIQLELKRADDEARAAELLDWQELEVVEIVRSKTNYSIAEGVSFAEIKSQYVTQVTADSDVEHPKESLSDRSLKRILFDLETLGVIYRTYDNTYLAQASIGNPRFLKAFAEEEGKIAILTLLTRKGGEYSVSELGQQMSSAHSIHPTDFNVLINELIASNAVLIDGEGKVWCVANPPPRQRSVSEE
jgi:hypothetical protein